MNPQSPLLEEKLPIFQISHISFDEFEGLYTEFKHNVLFHRLRDLQRLNPIESSLFVKFYDVYARHFSLQNAELHQLHWFFDSRWRDLFEEFHYPAGAMASITSPALKMFRNLRLRSQVLITDERVLHFLNIIKEDLEDENKRVAGLLRELNRVFQERVVGLVESSIASLKNLDCDELAKKKESISKIIKNFIIIPLKEIIMFLYDRVIQMMAQNLSSYNLEEQIYAITEQFVFKQKYGIYETIQNLLFFENHNNRKLLREERFLNKDFQDIRNDKFEIADEFRVEEKHYLKAIEMMKRLTKKRSSYEKLRVLYEIHQTICESMQKFHGKFNAREKMSADNLVPLFIYLIHKSKNYNLHQDVEFCEKFARESLDGDYLFCIFKSSLEYVTITQ